MAENNHSRQLLIVSILHAKEDMGSLGNRLSVKDGYSAVVSNFWEEVRQKVKTYLNGSKKIKVYQDGLPNTSPKIINKILAEVESPNYELLRFLKSKGAQIFGTEDPKLLKEEYHFIQRIVSQGNASEEKAADLLVKRDSYIANRINRTLKPGDLGILFIGAAHGIKAELPKDIQVEIL